MGIGVSILLLVIGAILAFAIEVDIPGISDNVVGYILIAAGLLGLVLTLAFWSRRRSSVAAGPGMVSERRTYVDPGGPPPPAGPPL